MKNFNFPYFSKNISEFWKRWHISLSSWFRDYLYIPLGGNRKGFNRSIFNVAVIFLVSGFWHGANWTFIVWGGIHALFYIPAFIGRNKMNSTQREKSLFGKYSFGFISGVFTFIVVCFAWIFFRAESLSQAIDYVQRIHFSGFSPQLINLKYIIYLALLDLIILHFSFLSKRILKNVIVRYSFYSILIFSILSHSTNLGSDFIYFQF
jgi:D-alanyl-lipoteichoic acid acyltransferase DltB (MBOAT superfamily)